jgi:hypothetical protein
MDPQREEQPKALPPSAEPKPKRFRIVKLEERIAPGNGPHGQSANHGCGFTSPLGMCSPTAGICVTGPNGCQY